MFPITELLGITWLHAISCPTRQDFSLKDAKTNIEAGIWNFMFLK